MLRQTLKEIARQKPEVKLSPGGMEVLAEHVKAMNFKYSKITDAEPEIKLSTEKFVELEQAGKTASKGSRCREKEPEECRDDGDICAK